MNKQKKGFVLFLCLLMLVSVCGCGKKAADEVQNTSNKDYVYTTEFKTVNADYMESPRVQDGKVYYQSYAFDEATQNYGYKACAMDLETLEVTEFPLVIEGNESISQFQLLEDGSCLTVSVSWNEGSDTSNAYLVWYGASGAEIKRQDITAAITGNSDAEWGGGAYPQSVCLDADGNICILVSGQTEKIVVFNPEGQKLFELESDSWFQSLCCSGDGQILALSYDYSASDNSYMLQAVDTKAKAFGASYKGIPGGNGNVYCAPGEKNEMLISSGNVLYSYDLNSQAITEILNWIDCDINSDSLMTLSRLEDGRILTLTYDHESDSNRCEAVYLTQTPASEVTQKTILTFGTMYLDYSLRKEIIQFNKTNSTYRIEVKEYGGGDWDAGQTQMNSDIVSGNTPDIIDLSNINTETYISKGILTDLYALMDADPDIKRDDFLPNALQIYEQDGKLYGIFPFFNISTLMGKTSDVGEKMGWTVDDVKALMASKPEGTQLMPYANREGILQTFLMVGAESYVDWSTGECSFDSPEFISLLEFANSFPSAESLNYEDYEGQYTQISQGKLLVVNVHLSDVTEYLAQAAMFGEPVTCIGYPTPDGSNGSILYPSTVLGISEKSKNKEGAWEFVKTVLTEEYQNPDNGRSWGFPTRKDCLEMVFTNAMDEEAGYGSSYGWDDFTFEGRPATRQEIDALRAVIESAGASWSDDEQIMNIVTEEAAPYFAGQKTAQEVANIIQSRVKMYVSENS